MTPETLLEMSQARKALLEISFVQADTRNRVRAAHKLGISKAEIHKLSGLARSTIDRYLGHQP